MVAGSLRPRCSLLLNEVTAGDIPSGVCEVQEAQIIYILLSSAVFDLFCLGHDNNND